MYSCAYIMDTQLKPNTYIVEHLLYPGLYVLAGASKIGKSWLALDLCLSVAEGEQFLKHETHKSQVLYLALEDSLIRLQDRLYEFTDEPAEGLHFSTLANSISGGLKQQLDDAKKKLSDLRLIVIDTLQKVRRTFDVKYGSDYSELSALKSVADRLGLAILLIHHTRKERDSDPFNMISGTTGIIGCADGSFVLVRESRSDKIGKLYCTGRDIESAELSLRFEGHRWIVTDEVEPHKRDTFSFAVHDLMNEQGSFRGTATQLNELLRNRFGKEYAPSWLTRNLIQHTDELLSYGVSFRLVRVHGYREIELKYDRQGDSKDGVLLLVEIVEDAVTQSLENLLTEPIALGDSKFEPFPPICGAGRVTIPPRGDSREFEPFLSPCEQIKVKAKSRLQSRTEFQLYRASALCTGRSGKQANS